MPAGFDEELAPQWQPTLRGPRIHLRPLRPDDFDALHAAASDPLIWVQHPDPGRHERAAFERYFASGLACGGALFATDPTDPTTGRCIGSSRYYEWNADDRTVAIGYTFLVRALWGSGVNGEMKRLMLEHAFRWARTVWFHVGAENVRSQRALERIGAVLHTSLEPAPSGPRRVYRIDRGPHASGGSEVTG